MKMDPVHSSPHTNPAWSITKLLHLATGIVLIVGLVAYWMFKPATLNPVVEPQAIQALALVQTHQAKQAPTLLQALTNRAKEITERGKGIRIGEWNVDQLENGDYVVSVRVREEGTKQWFENEYAWRVDVHKSKITPYSNYAVELMPTPRSTKQ